jgi:hypothetical protein
MGSVEGWLTRRHKFVMIRESWMTRGLVIGLPFTVKLEVTRKEMELTLSVIKANIGGYLCWFPSEYLALQES